MRYVLHRPRFDHAQRRARRYDARHLEAGVREERGVLVGRALAAAGRQEHLEIDDLGHVRRVARRDDGFEKEDASGGAAVEARANVLKKARGWLILPVI